MEPLADADDVARAMGLADSEELSEAHRNRVDGLLARVSREFRKEAERPFSPGTFTVTLLTVGGKARLPERSVTVASVTGGDGAALEYTLEGQEIVLTRSRIMYGSGVPVTVTYTHDGVIPDEVRASVADIVSRHLSIDPTSAEAQSTELSTLDFRQRFASWVSEKQLLTDGERAEARSYRYPGTAVIVHR